MLPRTAPGRHVLFLPYKGPVLIAGAETEHQFNSLCSESGSSCSMAVPERLAIWMKEKHRLLDYEVPGYGQLSMAIQNTKMRDNTEV